MKWVEETVQTNARIYKLDHALLKGEGPLSNIIRACVRAYANSIRKDRGEPLLPGLGEYTYEQAMAYPEVRDATMAKPTEIEEAK